MLSQKTKEIHIRDMITMDNKDYARQYVLDRGLKNKTYTKILTILDHYSNFQGMSIDELIQEADQEEEQGIRWKRRKLKHRLINYMNYCKQECYYLQQNPISPILKDSTYIMKLK